MVVYKGRGGFMLHAVDNIHVPRDYGRHEIIKKVPIEPYTPQSSGRT